MSRRSSQVSSHSKVPVPSAKVPSTGTSRSPVRLPAVPPPGADLEVVEPLSLRARLAGTAARLATIYQVSPRYD